MKPKLSDIAKRLGISVSQVSRALSNKNGVDPELRESILAEAVKIGYQNNSGKHASTLALVFHDMDADSIHRLNRLRKRFRRKKYKVFSLTLKSVDFLSQYRFDRVIGFELSDDDWSKLVSHCSKFGCEPERIIVKRAVP